VLIASFFRLVKRYRPGFVVRESPDSKEVNPEVEKSTALGAVTKQRLVKAQQTEKA
jgi:hypothetical protein